jgi:hypothetical protein
MKDVPIVCRLDALDPPARARREALWSDLRAQALEIREDEDGFSFRFHTDAHAISKLVEFMALERLCCPFLRFEIAVHPDGGPTWLRVGESAQIKAFLKETLAWRNSDSSPG